MLDNSELWFYSCTAEDRHLLLRPFKRANFSSDIEDIINQRVVHTAENFYNDQDHATPEAEDLLIVPNHEQLDKVIVLYLLVFDF